MKKNILILSICLIAISCGSTRNLQTFNYTMPTSEIKLISYNIRHSGASRIDGEHRWSNRRHATVNMIQQEAPSVLGLQEALPGQMRFIQRNFRQYDHVGVGRDGRRRGEFSAIFFLRERFELLDEGTFWLSETPERVSIGWDARQRRIVTWVKLRERYSGKEFYFFNTHLDHRGEKSREKSIKLIVERIREIAQQDKGIIFGGDLNAPLSDSAFDPITYFMVDARECSPISDDKGTFNAFGAVSPPITIDFILSKNVICKSFRTLTGDYGAPFISDHYPIQFVFRLLAP